MPETSIDRHEATNATTYTPLRIPHQPPATIGAAEVQIQDGRGGKEPVPVWGMHIARSESHLVRRGLTTDLVTALLLEIRQSLHPNRRRTPLVL